MRHSFKYVQPLFISFLLLACNSSVKEKGNGNIITQERSVKEFSKVTIKGNFEVLLKKSSSPAVVITTDENLQGYIQVDQRKDVVNITTNEKLKSREPIQVVVQYVHLNSLSSSGSSRIKSEETIKGDFLQIAMSGAGSINLQVELKALNLVVSGAGAVGLKGYVQEQNIRLTGAGGLEAYKLISEQCKIEISGVGGAAIHVRKKLVASVSGVGGISYRGNPEKVETNVSGMGTIRNAEKKREN